MRAVQIFFDRMARPNLAAGHAVVEEVSLLQLAGFVADQAIFDDLGRVEFDLHFGVVGDRRHGRTQFLDEHLARFHYAVEIGGLAVAGMGQTPHQGVVAIVGADSQDGQINPQLAFAGDQLSQLPAAGADACSETSGPQAISVAAQSPAIKAGKIIFECRISSPLFSTQRMKYCGKLGLNYGT